MLYKTVLVVVVFLGLMTGDIHAGNLSSYKIGDVLLCFRKSGGTNDLVVDLGPVSTYTNLAPNSRTVLTQYTGNQLATISTNNLIWSAYTWFDATVTPSGIQWTLFASKLRDTLNVQSQAVVTYSQGAQHQVGNNMANVPKGAYDNYVTTDYNVALNTSAAVLEPDNQANLNYKTGLSYSTAIGPDFNFQDTYQDYPENTTPSNFTTGGSVQRSDFYWLPPGNGLTTLGVFLGYFELNTNGVMTYVAYPTAVPATPVVQSITRTNNVTYVTFTTGPSGTYALRGTNILNSAVANWPTITSAAGTGSPLTLQDTTSVSNKFYAISAQ